MKILKRGNTTRIVEDSCGKRGYKSKAKALKAHRTYYARVKGRMRPYKCPRCGLWHVTSC